MAIKMVMFDLDGTLLPMDMDAFVGGYFRLLAAKAALRGYEAKGLVKAVWQGTAAMVRNDGSCTNEDAFWQEFTAIYGAGAIRDKDMFEDFYANEFGQAQQFCGFHPMAAEAVAAAKAKGFRVGLATNPIFPSVATETRIRWAGLKSTDFEFFTTYENSSFCKPNLAYYRALLEQCGLKGEEVLMVGNDVGEDMIAEGLGMKVFLLTDCLINKEGTDLRRYPNGSFEQLLRFLDDLAEDTHE